MILYPTNKKHTESYYKQIDVQVKAQISLNILEVQSGTSLSTNN